jgi:hypothetical protein
MVKYGNPRPLSIFFCIINKSQSTRKRSGLNLKLATDMAFASTPYIKAGIDLFFFHKQRVFKCHFNNDTIQYQVTKG